MIEVSKSKSKNKYFKSEILNNRTKGYYLILCQTGVPFLGHPVDEYYMMNSFYLKCCYV